MRVRSLAWATIYLLAGAGCSGELAVRPAINDPTNLAATEAPFSLPPSYQQDPLLNAATPKSAEMPPTGSPAVYTCPMHPEVRSRQPGKCPKCGMTLVPADDERGEK